MVARSAITLKCDTRLIMRAYKAIIAIFITLLAVSCSPESHYHDSSNRSDIAYLWSLAKHGSTTITEDITFCGTVVANDKLNEVTNRIVVADESGGIEIAIEAEYIEDIIPIFSNVRVCATGLSIGRQGRKCVLGTSPTGEYVVDRLTERELPYYISPADDIATLRAQRMDIGEINNEDLLHYIYIENVGFIDEEIGMTWSNCDTIDGNKNSIRHLTDGVDTMRVACSEECTYAKEPLPTGKLKCFGIVDYVDGDIALRISNHYIVEELTL